MVLMARSANIWLSSLRVGPLGTCSPRGEVDSRYKYASQGGLGKSFLFIGPRGTPPPSSKEPLQGSVSPEGSSHCSEHTRLLSRDANLGFKINEIEGADTFHLLGLGQALGAPVVINTLSSVSPLVPTEFQPEQ